MTMLDVSWADYHQRFLYCHDKICNKYIHNLTRKKQFLVHAFSFESYSLHILKYRKSVIFTVRMVNYLVNTPSQYTFAVIGEE